MDNEESTSAVNESAEQNTATTESASVENNSSEQTEVTTEESTDESANVGETQDNQSDSQEDSEDNKPKSKAEQRKEQLNSQIEDANAEIRDLVEKKNNIYAERDEMRRSVEAESMQFYQPQTVDQIMQEQNPDTGEAYSRLEAQFEALQQERELERYNNQVTENRLGIREEARQALHDFPMFDEKSPKFNKELAQTVDEILKQSLEFDPNTNQLIGSRVSPYKLYQSYAKAAQVAARKAEIQGQKNTERMMSSVDSTAGGQGKPSKSFEELSTKEMEAHLRAKGHMF